MSDEDVKHDDTCVYLDDMIFRLIDGVAAGDGWYHLRIVEDRRPGAMYTDKTIWVPSDGVYEAKTSVDQGEAFNTSKVWPADRLPEGTMDRGGWVIRDLDKCRFPVERLESAAEALNERSIIDSVRKSKTDREFPLCRIEPTVVDGYITRVEMYDNLADKTTPVADWTDAPRPLLQFERWVYDRIVDRGLNAEVWSPHEYDWLTLGDWLCEFEQRHAEPQAGRRPAGLVISLNVSRDFNPSVESIGEFLLRRAEMLVIAARAMIVDDLTHRDDTNSLIRKAGWDVEGEY